MAKVILSLEGSVIREMNLDKERITIGRKPQNDIQIENLAVSSEHARIVTILNDSFLEDLGSTNGTLVNGNPIKKHILQNDDVIEIGKYTLKYVGDSSTGQTSAEDFERTMVLRMPSAPQRPAAPARTDTLTRMAAPASASTLSAPPAAAPAARPASPPPAPAPAPAAAAGHQAHIQILSGPGAGRELPLVKNLTTLGKPGVQVAVITKRPQGYFITHVEGANYPILNGITLGAQAHALNNHDLVEIAGVKMEFFFK